MKRVSLFLFLAIALIGCDKDNVVNPTGKATGKFFVSADKQVVFSPGNLQYTQSTNTWSFAKHQYDTIGAANMMNDSVLADKIDLFGWSTDNTTAPFGVSTSNDEDDYAGDFIDWGTNKIGNDAPNTWRTLTIYEWEYLFQRTRWTMATVNNTLGFMLLPDGFKAPKDLTVNILGDGKMLYSSNLIYKEPEYSSNVYTATEFAQLEALGCVFLPCAGYRDDYSSSNVYSVGRYGYYWSATPYNSKYESLRYEYAYGLSFGVSYAETYDYRRYNGYSVRLVRDIK